MGANNQPMDLFGGSVKVTAAVQYPLCNHEYSSLVLNSLSLSVYVSFRLMEISLLNLIPSKRHTKKPGHHVTQFRINSLAKQNDR